MVDAQGLVQGVQQGAREGNKAAGPVGGVLGGAIGGVVGVVTGVTGVITGKNGQPAPAHLATTRLPFERHVFKVTAAVTLVRHENDSDLHLVLRAGSDHMIAEAPSPGCTKMPARASSTTLWMTPSIPSSTGLPAAM